MQAKKTAFFIIGSGMYMLSYYDFAKLLNVDDFTLIAIVNRKIIEDFPATQRSYFAKIHAVKENTNLNTLCQLDVTAVEQVFKSELEQLVDRSTVRIFAYNEYTIAIAAYLREKYGIWGQKIEVVELFRNKIAMKQQLADANIRVPKFTTFDFVAYSTNAKDYYQKLVANFGTIFIVKPVDGAGTSGVYKICSWNDFIWLGTTISHKFSGYEIEEFINGRLFHCDMVLKDSNPVVSLCAEYNFPLMEFKDGKNIGSIPLLDNSSFKERLTKFAATALTTLQLTHGITHTEIFFLEEQNDFVFLETAARPGGLLVIPMYQKTFGTNLLNLDFLINMDMPYTSEINQSMTNSCAFWAITPMQEGVVKKLLFPKLKSQCEIEWYVNVGDRTMPAKGLADKTAKIFAWNDNPHILKQDFVRISDNALIEYVNLLD